MRKTKHIVFALVSLFAGCVLAIACAEAVLVQYQRWLQSSDQLDQGMIRYHPVFGWRLNSNWQGHHSHHDFNVSYSTNAGGYRANGTDAVAAGGRRIYLIGDSFTFGIGVNDSETFSALLAAADKGTEYRNYGLPGSSTDQHWLMLDREILVGRAPEQLILVVYLGNDLLDLTRPIPLQAAYAKPWFELNNKTLVLRGVPVPRQPPAIVDPSALALAVTGGQLQQSGFTRYWNSLKLVQLVGLRIEPDPEGLDLLLDQNLSSSVDVFNGVLKQLKQRAAESGIELRVMLVGGQSYVLETDLLSHAYQAWYRERLLTILSEEELSVIDVAGTMLNAEKASRRQWYFPNEGHLTPAGHQYVAELLGVAISKESK